MSLGEIHPGRRTTYADPLTGVTVHRLTGDCCHANHVYFTHSGWHDGGTRLLVSSDRDGSGNLYSLEIATGDLRQLTDHTDGVGRSFFYAVPTPDDRAVVVVVEGALIRIDLGKLTREELWRVPEGWVNTGAALACDGGRFYCAVREDLSDRVRTDLGHGYIGFRETWAAHPTSRLLEIDLGSGAERELWSEGEWIGHVNASPADPTLVTFCHEGPWDEVDNRIWLLRRGEKPRKVADHRDDGVVGHEYWFADGSAVGYHGWRPDLGGMLGHARIADGGWFEAPLPIEKERSGPQHVHSLDADLVAADCGRTTVQLWTRANEAYRAFELCEHRASFHVQRLHVHPRLSPDAARVLFTADPAGYGQVHLAEVPSLDALPAAEA